MIPDDYNYCIEVLRSGSVDDLEELASLEEDFPKGKDRLLMRRWITNAIDCGSKEAIKWILKKKVDVIFRDDEGYTVLHSAIERNEDDKYEIMELLLKFGADVNLKGINDWTPAHLAAARNDVEALKILVKYGADLNIRTDIDDYATPLEEARILNSLKLSCSEAIKFLEDIIMRR
ncbi:ankyrin repeat domain-containing protein [Pleurocapsales cyanobacterium LEGE 10410]|nr:ankyrin repeat domain-containing protein [Pleurocapsales cyanobacterium LEGE 10410]